MDRTARMLRRTLLCAVLACPLAIGQLEAAWIAQLIFSVFPIKEQRGPWYKKTSFPHRWRGVIVLFPSLALQAALATITDQGVLIALTGILTQASLILGMQKTGRRSLAACLISLLVFIACMR